jgi:isoamylase
LSFRGIDNASYYKLTPQDPRFYWDCTGTGNTLDISHPRVLQMVLDSLRYWVEHFHIDGFRFDLAPALTRDYYDVSAHACFLRTIGQDPVLARVKLIAEPWDLGEGGYRLGGFAPGWSEWNDRFRDPLRAYWRGDPGQLPTLAQAIAGSREIFQRNGRHAWASIQYICSHDGFALHDLVSYNERHNEPNGHNSNDGHPNNFSWNCGVEGETDDPEIAALRARQKRNLLASLFLSIGTPMLLMGDELSRSQNGNNNAYCQDNEISWLDWQAAARRDPHLLSFVQALAELRNKYKIFCHRNFLSGEILPNGLKDAYWLAPEGREMTTADWTDSTRRALGVQIGNGAPDGRRLLLLFNAAPEQLLFMLPPDFPSRQWIEVLNTNLPQGLVREAPAILKPGGTFELRPRSLVLLQHAEELA